jgi:hypothetical protein
MDKICPCCQLTFDCRNDYILECWCITEQISQAAREFMAHHYEGCLCRDCIQKINQSLTHNYEPEINTEHEKH